jgi:hypothetical protein
MEDKKKKPTSETSNSGEVRGSTPSRDADWIVSIPSTKGTYYIEKEDKSSRDKKHRTV